MKVKYFIKIPFKMEIKISDRLKMVNEWINLNDLLLIPFTLIQPFPDELPVLSHWLSEGYLIKN